MSHTVTSWGVSNGRCTYSLPEGTTEGQMILVKRAVRGLSCVKRVEGDDCSPTDMIVVAHTRLADKLDTSVEAAIRQALGSNEYEVVAG